MKAPLKSVGLGPVATVVTLVRRVCTFLLKVGLKRLIRTWLKGMVLKGALYEDVSRGPVVAVLDVAVVALGVVVAGVVCLLEYLVINVR